jgi:nucleobase:cation symporter-1, NCS1 family
MRNMFGVWANRLNLLVSGWGICVAYLAINLSVGSLAGFAPSSRSASPPAPGACIAVLAWFVITHADLGSVPPDAPQGAGLWAAALAGVTIIAAGPLNWGTSADYARYLPSSTSPRSVAGWTALGVLAGTAVEMTDPQQAPSPRSPAQWSPHWSTAH